MSGNLIPAGNIQFAALAAFIVSLIEHLCTANGIIIPADVSSGLTGLVAVLAAHVADMVTGDNKKTTLPISQSQAAAKD